MLAEGSCLLIGQADVYSENVVGYVKLPLTGGGRFNSVANPLNTTNNTIGSLLAGIPNASQVLKWNHDLLDFEVINKTPFGTWSPGGSQNITLNPGEGVLIKSGAAFTNTFEGEVLQGSLTNSFPVGYEVRASKVPQAGLLTDLGLEFNRIPTPSQLLKWDSAAGIIGNWVTFTKTPFGGWHPYEPSLNIGESFLFISYSGPFNWIRNFTVQ